MNTLKTLVAALLFAFGLAAAPASAAPLSPNNWSGFYVGASAAYGWKSNDTTMAVDPSSGAPGLFGPAITNAHIPQSLTVDTKGGLGGFQFGYNWQSGAVVYGAEADLAYGKINGNKSFYAASFGGFPQLTTTHEQSMDWFGTLRARLGYLPTPAVLAYVTGGLAVGRVKASTDVNIPINNGCASSLLCNAGSLEQTRTGWTVGGGMEFAVAAAWTVKADYLYYDLGSATYTLYTTAPTFPGFAELQSTVKFNGHIVRLGVNRRF